MTQTIELQIPEELLRLVDERAQTAGLPREAYIRAVLSKDVSGELSLSAILAPFRDQVAGSGIDRKSTRLNSSHLGISYAVFSLKKKQQPAMTPSGSLRYFTPGLNSPVFPTP